MVSGLALWVVVGLLAVFGVWCCAMAWGGWFGFGGGFWVGVDYLGFLFLDGVGIICLLGGDC